MNYDDEVLSGTSNNNHCTPAEWKTKSGEDSYSESMVLRMVLRITA